jgi:hypothetical protein
MPAIVQCSFGSEYPEYRIAATVLRVGSLGRRVSACLGGLGAVRGGELSVHDCAIGRWRANGNAELVFKLEIAFDIWAKAHKLQKLCIKVRGMRNGLLRPVSRRRSLSPARGALAAISPTPMTRAQLRAPTLAPIYPDAGRRKHW